MGARGSPFPAGFGFGLGLRLGLPGLGASATVLRGFGSVCDLVFIPPRRRILFSYAPRGAGGLREVCSSRSGERPPEEGNGRRRGRAR